VKLLAVLYCCQWMRPLLIEQYPAYLVCDYGTTGCTSVCCNDHTAIVESTDDGSTGRSRLGEGNASSVEGEVAVVV
jgi:hypothetical protein